MAKNKSGKDARAHRVDEKRGGLEPSTGEMEDGKPELVQDTLLRPEGDLLSRAGHPALRLIGIAGVEHPDCEPLDAARGHDRVLTEGIE